MKRIFIVLSVFVLILLLSCKKDFSKISTTHWKPDVAAPFVQTEMTLRNLMGIDSVLEVEDDSLMVYYYQKDSIINLTADSLLSISDSVISSYEFSLGDLMISDFEMEASVSLNDLLPYMNGDVADSLMSHNGDTALFPPFQLMSTVNVEIPPNSQYETLTFSEGYFDIQITNQLPVSLNNIRFDVLDVINNTVIKSVTIDNIAPNEVVHDTLFLHGKTLSNTFSFVIHTIESDGSYPDSVLIDLSQGLDLQMMAKEMRIISGFAKIEDQIIYSTHKQVNLDFDDVRLWEILCSGGVLKYQMQSYFNLSVNILLQLSSANIDGEIPEDDFMLPANSFYSSSWDLTDMRVDLTQDSTQPYNRMPVYLEIVVEPTNTMVQFDSSDNVVATFAMQNMKVAYASGNMGRQTYTLNEDTIDIDLSFFENIDGDIIFDDPTFSVNYQNGFGIPLLTYTSFYGINHSTGNSVDLGVDSLIFNYPSEVGEVIEDSMIYNKTNSNIVDMLNVRPDKIIFSGEALTNWNNDTINFFTETSSLTANTEIKIPMVFSTSSLIFQDTVDFLAGSADIPIGSGSLLLNVTNGLPFDLLIQLQIPDSITGEIIDHVDFDIISSAIVDNEGKVIASTESNVKAVFSESFINNMSRANTLLLSAETVSAEGGTIPVGLYSDYKLSIAISFEATVQP